MSKLNGHASGHVIHVVLLLPVLLSAAPIQEAEVNAIDFRRALRSGELVVHTHYNRPHGQNGAQAIDSDFHFWWDGESFRQDEINITAGRARTSTRNSWHAGNQYHWDAAYKSPDGVAVVTIEPAVRGDSSPYFRINILNLGMIPCPLMQLHAHPLDYVLANPNRQSTTTEQVELNGVNCALITIRQKIGTARYWFDPVRGYNPVRCAMSGKVGRFHMVNSIDVELAAVPTSGTWFPASYKYSRLVDGQLDEEEEGSVQVISLNEPIPKEVFTFAGMGLPAGARVSDLTRPDVDGAMAWDGVKVVAQTRAQRKVTAEYRTNLVYVVLSAALAIVAAVLLWRFLALRSDAGRN